MDIKLTLFDPVDTDKDHFIYINFDNIVYYSEVKDFPEYTELIFKDGNRVVVSESCEEIYRLRNH